MITHPPYVRASALYTDLCRDPLGSNCPPLLAPPAARHHGWSAEWISRQITEAFPVGQWASLSYSGSGHGIWPGLRASVARHGHSGQADCSPIAVAECIRRETEPTASIQPGHHSQRETHELRMS